MSKCKYLIDISPYDPLCDHPCRLYGGGAVEAECETCQYRIEDLEVENAKLRELCWRFAEYVGQDRCEGCVFKSRCNAGLVDECWQLTEIRELASELGIEVDV